MKQLLTHLALKWLTRMMKRDPGLAWSWHCNIAMAYFDQRMLMGDKDPHRVANYAARRFMEQLFKVDVATDPAWKSLEEHWNSKEGA